MTILPITITMAGAAALLNLWMAMRIGSLRHKHKVSIGDGGNEALIARMRAQANFIEFTPIFLILLGLIELAEGSMIWLWVVAILYVLARIAHVFGMDRLQGSPLRTAGAAVTMLSTIVLAVYALSIPYRHKSLKTGIIYVSANQAPASTRSPTNGLVLRS
jgi:uncharacterized protein